MTQKCDRLNLLFPLIIPAGFRKNAKRIIRKISTSLRPIFVVGTQFAIRKFRTMVEVYFILFIFFKHLYVFRINFSSVFLAFIRNKNTQKLSCKIVSVLSF